MKTEISSSITGVLRFVWVPFAILLPIAVYQQLSGSTEDNLGWSLDMSWYLSVPTIIFGVALILFLRWLFGRFARVEVDSTSLYVHRRGMVHSVPLKTIESVTSRYLVRPESIVIKLSSPAPFGNRITFIPTVRLFAFGPHPIVEELNQLAVKSRSTV